MICTMCCVDSSSKFCGFCGDTWVLKPILTPQQIFCYKVQQGILDILWRPYTIFFGGHLIVIHHKILHDHWRALIKTVLENGNVIWKKVDIKSCKKFHSTLKIRPFKVTLRIFKLILLIKEKLNATFRQYNKIKKSY